MPSEVALPGLTVCVLPLKYEAIRAMSEARHIDQRYLIDESAICCGQLYRKLRSSLAAPSMMLGDYQRLLADRCESSAMPSLCCDLFYRLIVLSHTDCVTAYDGIVLQQKSFLPIWSFLVDRGLMMFGNYSGVTIPSFIDEGMQPLVIDIFTISVITGEIISTFQ